MRAHTLSHRNCPDPSACFMSDPNRSQRSWCHTRILCHSVGTALSYGMCYCVLGRPHEISVVLFCCRKSCFEGETSYFTAASWESMTVCVCVTEDIDCWIFHGQSPLPLVFYNLFVCIYLSEGSYIHSLYHFPMRITLFACSPLPLSPFFQYISHEKSKLADHLPLVMWGHCRRRTL